MAGFFKTLRELLSGKSTSAESIGRSVSEQSGKPGLDADPVKRMPSRSSAGWTREHYFVQIGFDFGTAFCKCICRDVFLNKAWIHIPPCSTDEELPFLIGSSLHFDGKTLRHANDIKGSYGNGGLHHLKMALQKVGLEEWGDPVLKPYRTMTSDVIEDVATLAKVGAIYLIAGTLGEAKREVANRFPGIVNGDRLAVNMAVPVADADHPNVSALFERVLRHAWLLADELASHPPIKYEEIKARIQAVSKEAEREDVRDACFVYPEVSANVQGFIHSRTSSTGTYLVSDTGAGTVDQSVFHFIRHDGKNHQTYLHAAVIPLGSSHIEMLAAIDDGDDSWENLERWRQKKESGEKRSQLEKAKGRILNDLDGCTLRTIAYSKQKLIQSRQINNLRVIFAGGGHSENPYGLAVTKQFDGRHFRSDLIGRRRREHAPFVIGMPIPNDLQLKDGQHRWMRRLSVAYGLSFEKGDLATFRLPSEIETPTEEEIRRRSERQMYSAPSKDEV